MTTSPTLARIKAAQEQAMRDKDQAARALLSTLFGEAVLIGKNAKNAAGEYEPRETTEAEVLKLTKDFVKKAEETATSFDKLGRAADAIAYRRQVEILRSFLPAAPTAAELDAAIEAEVAKLTAPSMKDMKTVLEALAARFGDALDRQVAAPLVKSRLSR